MQKRRLAVVSGGSRGIGEYVVRSFLEGMDVLNISRTPANDHWEGSKGRLFNINTDLAKVNSLTRALKKWFSYNSDYRVEFLISNAATLSLNWLTNISEEQFIRTFKVNVNAPLALSSTLYELGQFSEHAARIIYVTSSLARPEAELSFAGVGLYSASKAALNKMAQVQAREFELVAPHIRVVRVHPGIVDTDMQKDLRTNAAIDPAFVQKTRGLPPYEDGEWDDRPPMDNMRTISARHSADFIAWVANLSAWDLQDEYDFYAASDFHRDLRSSRHFEHAVGRTNRRRVRS